MRTTIADLQKMREANTKIASLTCYDSSFAALLESCGVDVLLVGDSLGMVVKGGETTLDVSMADMVYHTRCVAASSQKAFIVSDMPFGSYQATNTDAFKNAAKLLSAGAQMVKMEGAFSDTVKFLVKRGIPVCGHLGLTPQSVHSLGGYKVQGKIESDAQRLLEEAKLLQAAGAQMIVLEAIPARLAAKITQNLAIPTMGIGAGPNCSAQVLVLYDMLDIYPGKKARFVKNFMSGAPNIAEAIRQYVLEVKGGQFPSKEHCF